jgi:hypothetical protein
MRDPNMRTNQGMRKGRAAAGSIVVALGVAIATVGMALSAGSAAAVPGEGGPDPKVVVCKYVGTPGQSTLQEGGNPIEVSGNTLNQLGWDGSTFPFYWTDAQGNSGGSAAIGLVGEGLDITDCPGYVPPTVDECENLQGDQPAGFECTKEPDSGVVASEGEPDCVTGTVAKFVQSWTQEYTFTDGAWVLGEKQYGAVTPDGTRDATEEECPTGTTPTVAPSEIVPTEDPGDPGNPGNPGSNPGNGGTQPTVLPAESMAPGQVVPTAVDAGLASSPTEEPGNGMVLIGLGLGLALVGGAFGFAPGTARGKRQA